MTVKLDRPRSWISLRKLRNNIDLGRMREPIEEYNKLWLHCWMDGGVRVESVDLARMNSAWTPREIPENCVAVEGNFSKYPSFSYMSGLFSTPYYRPDMTVDRVGLVIDNNTVDRVGYSTGPMFDMSKDSYLITGRMIDREDKKKVDCRNYKHMFKDPTYDGNGQKLAYWVQVEDDYQAGYYLTRLGHGRHTWNMIDVDHTKWKHTDAVVALDQMNMDQSWMPMLPSLALMILSLYRNEPWDYIYTDSPIVEYVINSEIEHYGDTCKIVRYMPPESSSIEMVEQNCHLGRALQESCEMITPQDAVALKLPYEDANIQQFQETDEPSSVLVIMTHHREYARDFAHMLRMVGHTALPVVLYNLQHKHDHKRIVSSSKIPPFENCA